MNNHRLTTYKEGGPFLLSDPFDWAGRSNPRCQEMDETFLCGTTGCNLRICESCMYWNRELAIMRSVSASSATADR